jgi:hypothetical protein
MGMVPYLLFVPSFARDVPNTILAEFPGISGHPLRYDPASTRPPYPDTGEIAQSIRAHLKATVSPRSKMIAGEPRPNPKPERHHTQPLTPSLLPYARLQYRTRSAQW